VRQNHVEPPAGPQRNALHELDNPPLAPTPSAALSSRQQLMVELAWLPVFGLAGVAAVRLFGFHFWPLELLWHFTETYFLLGLGLTVCLILLHRLGPAAATAALTIYFGFAAGNVPGIPPGQTTSLLPAAHARAAGAADAKGTGLRLVTHNLYVHNRRPGALAEWLAGQDADVIVFQEINEHTAAIMAAAGNRYPHQVFGWPKYYDERPELRYALNGLAILSRYPLGELSFFFQTKWSSPVVATDLLLPTGERVRVVVVHTSNPVRRSGLRSRNQLMAALAAELRRVEGPLVVAGDFNATPYTPAFARFLQDARLTTVRAYPGTYPQLAGDFGLPIDHVLVRGVRIAEIEALDAFGSDHRPLRADLVVPLPGDVH
jgi:endonuclease/exonuclease/phosphatase (EEP) superfamily protein YafD